MALLRGGTHDERAAAAVGIATNNAVTIARTIATTAATATAQSTASTSAAPVSAFGRDDASVAS